MDDHAPVTWVEGSLVGPPSEHLRYAGEAHRTTERLCFWEVVKGVIMSIPGDGEEDGLPFEFTEAATTALLDN